MAPPERRRRAPYGDKPYLSDLRTNVGVRYGHRNFGGEWSWFQMLTQGAWFIFDQPGFGQSW